MRTTRPLALDFWFGRARLAGARHARAPSGFARTPRSTTRSAARFGEARRGRARRRLRRLVRDAARRARAHPPARPVHAQHLSRHAARVRRRRARARHRERRRRPRPRPRRSTATSAGSSTCRSSTPRTVRAQDRSLALFARARARRRATRRRSTGREKHADVIRRFGRYPHRNAILGRASTAGGDRVPARAGVALLDCAGCAQRCLARLSAARSIRSTTGTCALARRRAARARLCRKCASFRPAIRRIAARRRPPPRDRLAMLRARGRRVPGLAVDEREIERAGKSYTVLTRSRSCAREDAARPLVLRRRRRRVPRPADVASLARDLRRSRTSSSSRGRASRSTTRCRRSSPADVEPPPRRPIRAVLQSTPAGAIFRQPITPQPISATAIRAQLARGADGPRGGPRFAARRRFGLY